jgi:integrase
MSTKRTRRGRSEGSVYRRGDGRWCGVVSLGVHGGKRIRRVVYGADKSEALGKLRDLQLRTDSGQLPDSAAVTVEVWLNRWLAIIKHSVQRGTLEPYTIHSHKHIIPRIGGVKIQRLRPADVEAFFSRLLSEGVSPGYVRKIGTTLSVALNHAVRSQLIPNNPSHGVRRPRADRHRIIVLDAAQVARFVKACETARIGPLFLLMLDSGIRPGEAGALTWKDIDFTANRVSITKSLEAGGEVKEPKTKQSRRTIDLTPGTMAALHGHRKAMLAQGRDVKRGVVFVGAGRVDVDGRSIIPNEITRQYLRPLLAAAGLPKIGAYSLRHTCATLLLAGGVNPKIVSERLGHSSIAITLDTYSHVLPGMQQAAVDVLGRALKGG